MGFFMREQLKIISGTSNRKLAEEIASLLNIPLTPVEIKRFTDGEIYTRILESVRSAEVAVVQSIHPNPNEALMEMLIMIDALKRSSPHSITAVIPYYGYSRQDKKLIAREPITAKLVAKMIEAAGADRIVSIELHMSQIQGFFDIPSDNLEVLPFFAQHILAKNLKDIVVISPDAGGTARARMFAKMVDAPIAIIDKRRPEQGSVEVMHIIGEVKGKTAVIIDDMIDSAGTITEASKALKNNGAIEIYACATHAVLSDPAKERLEKSPIKEVIITNTIDVPKEKRIDTFGLFKGAPSFNKEDEGDSDF